MKYIITKPENVFYLTGFKGSFGFVLIENQKQTLVTDNRYKIYAQELCKKNEISFLVYNKDFKKDHDSKVTGTWMIEDSNTLQKQSWLQELFPQAELEVQSGVIEKQRRCKTETEIDLIRQAQTHVDQILIPTIQKHARAGITEQALCWELEIALRNRGQYELSFDLIVAFGENSAIPHHSPGKRKLKTNENILVDCGVKHQGYCSDITRNFWFGDEVLSDYQKAFNQLLVAQESGVESVRVGVSMDEIDRQVRSELGSDADFFTHRLGHGVGLEIHEAPRTPAEQAEPLQLGEVITIEPGLYYDGRFGIRIEDLLVVKTQGAEILSQCPRELILIKA